MMKPVVDGIQPPKMPKKKKDGLVSWIKSIAGIDTEDKPKANVKPKRAIQNRKRKPISANKPRQNQPRNVNKKNVPGKPKKTPQKKNEPNKLKTDSSKNKTLDKKKVIDAKFKDKAPKKERVNKEQSSRPKPPKKELVNKEQSSTPKPPKKELVNKEQSSTPNSPQKEMKKVPSKREPAIKEIVKEPKVKKEIPTRAANDPRYKN